MITMKRKKGWKRWVAVLLVLVVLAGGGTGAWYYLKTQNVEPVNVYPFYYVGMTEYWGDSQESYGPVTTDKIQTVFLSETQSVTEVLVNQGDSVKKGDVLMRVDTTLSDLALERERLQVEKLKLQLEDAWDRLYEINCMRPMVIPVYTEPETPPEVNLGIPLTGEYQLSVLKEYDGSSEELALICWLHSDTPMDDELLEIIRQKIEEYQKYNLIHNPPEESKEEAVPEVTPRTVTEESSVEESSVEESSVEESSVEESSVEESSVEESSVEESSVEESSVEESSVEESSVEESSGEDSSGQQPPQDPEQLKVDHYFVVIKVTEGNMSLGTNVIWQGMEVTRDPEKKTYSFKFFDASMTKDHMVPDVTIEEPEVPEIDFGSGYTAAQIAEMRAQQEKAIKDLEFQVEMAEADYKIMQTEVSDGNIYAQIDGQVVSLLSEEEAQMTMQPIMKISDGGGFYVSGTVSELDRDRLMIGQEVTVNDWNTGMVYVGVIDSIGDVPDTSGYFSGMGNPNASYYPFTVFVDGSADLQAGSYVSVMYSDSVSQNGIYLENPFIRTEQGRSYVYVQGEDGLLEKRYVVTGKSLWGSYTEILEGLSAEDLIAFPYGKNLKVGAPAVESDISSLYG